MEIYIVIVIHTYIWYPPPPRPILSHNLLLFAVFSSFFSMFKCIFFVFFFVVFLRNREKTKKPKNQNFLEKVWSETHVWFFLVFLEFFWFFLVMTLKKLKKLKVFLVFWINWLLKTCKKPKKLRSFLVFCMDCFYMSSKNLSKNQKRPEFFWFFALLQVRVPSKNQKNLEFFSFFKVMTKKKQKTRGKPKKTNMSLRPNLFQKVLVFWFFGFSRFRGTSDSLGEKPWGTPKKKHRENQKTKKPKLFR